MQLLNSKILSNDKNTRYSNKKAQDTRVTCVFLSVVAFSYYKDGGDAGICLTAIVTEGQSRAAEGVHVAKQRHGFCRAKSPLRNKKRNSLRCSFFGGKPVTQVEHSSPFLRPPYCVFFMCIIEY